MREKLAKFMQGRYGPDALYRAQMGAGVALLVLSMLLRRHQSLSVLLNWAALAVLLWGLYRALSRNVDKRYRENLHFLEKVGGVQRQNRMNREKFNQRKEYKFFVCPNCKTNLRVPKGKGEVYITCSKCGTRFRGKT